jgi:IclR family transcriptional regulator, KDG regulon repressor
LKNNTHSAPALQKGIEIIKILSQSSRAMSLTELAEAADTNKNMMTRVLGVLGEHGWIEKLMPQNRYRLTLTPFAILGSAANRMPLREIASASLRRLWEDTGESIYLGVLHDNEVLYIDHFDGMGLVRIAGHIGGHYPLHCSAPGKILLAYGGEELFDEIVEQGLKRYTDATITDPDQLRRELTDIRDRGFALDREEYGRGLLCYAVPLFDVDHHAIATIGTSVTMLQYDLESLQAELGPKIWETGKSISNKIGFKEINEEMLYSAT